MGLVERLDELVGQRDALREENARLRAALADLVVWADWHHERYKSVHMNEPNTGALTAAHEVLDTLAQNRSSEASE